MKNTDKQQINMFPPNMTGLVREMNSLIVKHPETQNLMMSSIKFDVMLMEVAGCDAMVGFAHYFKVPVIGISTVRSNIFVQKWTATPCGVICDEPF